MLKKDKHFLVYKLVLSGLLVGWFIKLPVFYWTYINSTSTESIVSYSFFPVFFQRPLVAQIFYFLPFVLIPILLLKKRPEKLFVLPLVSILFVCSSLILMLHLSTYNDATFLTSFWVSLWLLWFSFHRDERDFKHAETLALALVSLMFLGGFVGKCTLDWWNGDALFGIMESFLNHFPFTWIKNNFTFDQLHTISKMMSWGIILMEFALATCVFWPRKIALKYVPYIMLGMIVFRTWKILSVIACLIVLLWSCLKLNSSEAPLEDESSSKLSA